MEIRTTAAEQIVLMTERAIYHAACLRMMARRETLHTIHAVLQSFFANTNRIVIEPGMSDGTETVEFVDELDCLLQIVKFHRFEAEWYIK